VELNKVGIKRMVIRMVVLGEEKMEMLLVLLGELFDLKVMVRKEVGWEKMGELFDKEFEKVKCGVVELLKGEEVLKRS